MGTFTNEFELARNFGFDITMAGGNMGMPGAAHQDYLARCRYLYKEFLSNMNVLIQDEKDVKKTLQALYKEKIKNMMYSLYRSEDAADGRDPFAKKQELALTPSSPMWESRGNTPWALETIVDEEEEATIRPQTAPARNCVNTHDRQTIDSNQVRPKTAGVDKTHIDDDEVSENCLTDTSETKEIVGVLDTKSERTSSRKITVSKHSFAKVSVKNTNIKLRNRDGSFIVKPMNDYFVKDKMDSVAFDPSDAYKNYDPINEKLALVRQVTSFKTPTIASDMKINNRVPIQKSLRGQDAKRVTVAEIYQNARDRRTRRFKLVVKQPSKLDKPSEDSHKTLQSNLLSVSSRPFSRRDSKAAASLDELRGRSRMTITRNSVHEIIPEVSSPDDSTDINNNEKVNLIKGNIDSKVRHNSGQGNIVPNNGCSKRPESRGVVFATTDSDLSPNHHDNEHLSPDSTEHNENSEGRQRSNSIFKFNRARRLSELPQNMLDYNANGEEGRRGSLLDNESPHLRRRTSLLDNESPYLGRRASQIENESPYMGRRVSCDRRMSIVSVASAGAFLVKLQNAVRKNSDASDAMLSFRPPTKVETMTDTRKIIKQQMQKDEQSDERMAIWKRRMVNAGASANRALLGSRKRGGRLRLI